MAEIKYWQLNNSLEPTDVKIDRKINRTENFRAFQAKMLGNLLENSTSSLSINPMGNFSNNIFSDESDLESRVKAAKRQGLEKVLAAQLSNPLPIFNQPQSSKQNQTNISGLDKMISLTMQAQMIKAKKILESQFQGVEVSETESQNGQFKDLSEFVTSLQSQIEIASKQFDLSIEQIKQSL